MEDNLLYRAATLLRPVPDFPIPGILFWDVQPILRDAEVMGHLIDEIIAQWDDVKFDVVAGFDARGFLFGQALALKLGLPFEQIRKKGKLPGRTICQEYALEYSHGILEMIDDGYIKGKRVLLMDDLLATGGTALAGAMLVERLGGTVIGFSAVTELPHLGGRGLLAGYRVHSLISIVEDQPVVGVEYCVDMFTQDSVTDELVLISRLSYPLGIAMPGGRIENESARAAVVRELKEETGCIPHSIEFVATLCEYDRDPRGVKISLVMMVFADASVTKDEFGRTKVFKVATMSDLPPREEFVLGHGPFVHEHWSRLCGG